jgi:hypothetical protein
VLHYPGALSVGVHLRPAASEGIQGDVAALEFPGEVGAKLLRGQACRATFGQVLVGGLQGAQANLWRTEGMLITVVVVVHPAAQSYLDAAARTDGAAATDREALGMETYGRLGAGTMRLINRLAGIAAGLGKEDKGVCVPHTLREMSMGMARYNGMLFRGGLKVMARVTGRMFQEGQREPSED